VEAITIIDALRRANADVVVASAEEGVEIVARHNTRIVTDVLLDAAAGQRFDLIIVPASRKLSLLLDAYMHPGELDFNQSVTDKKSPPVTRLIRAACPARRRSPARRSSSPC
jgi:putative intracellular protease/amidase